jgi:ubiquinone/menaquinone biosynthesis C-methylase UbiE
MEYKEVQEYWDSHRLGTQFLRNVTDAHDTPKYFVELDKAMERWDYKNEMFDWLASHFKGGVLLEVGCGLGTDLVKLGKRGFSIIGIDLAPTVVAMARNHLETYGLTGTVLRGNAESLAFPSEKFDIVYSSGVLQHTPNIQKAVNEIHRVIRRGGIAVVIVYYRYSWFNLLRSLTNSNVEFEDKDPPIINTYSKRQLRRIFSIFESVQLEIRYSYPTPTPRQGFLPRIYNQIFIPALKCVPYGISKHFGWHIVVKARK